MTRRQILPASLLVAAALISGCGSSDNRASAPSVTHKAAPSGGQLRVAATDLHLGDATAADPSGLRVLPRTHVTPSAQDRQGVGAGASCSDADLVPSAENLATVATTTLCLLNGERADAGLPALRQNGRLARAAVGHSQDMVDARYFDHLDKSGGGPVDRVRATGYIPSTGVWTVGENLAWGTGTLATPKAIVAAWMKSQGHRENILRPTFKEIGLGVVTGNPRSSSGSGATFTTAFGATSRAAAREVASTTGSRASGTSKHGRRHGRKARASRKHRGAHASRRK